MDNAKTTLSGSAFQTLAAATVEKLEHNAKEQTMIMKSRMKINNSS